LSRQKFTLCQIEKAHNVPWKFTSFQDLGVYPSIYISLIIHHPLKESRIQTSNAPIYTSRIETPFLPSLETAHHMPIYSNPALANLILLRLNSRLAKSMARVLETPGVHFVPAATFMATDQVPEAQRWNDVPLMQL